MTTQPAGTRRPTREEIRDKAVAHVAYGWAAFPGTHDCSIFWTAEDTAIYLEEFKAAKQRAKQVPEISCAPGAPRP